MKRTAIYIDFENSSNGFSSTPNKMARAEPAINPDKPIGIITCPMVGEIRMSTHLRFMLERLFHEQYPSLHQLGGCRMGDMERYTIMELINEHKPI
jgi:hypothetical protein